MSFDHSRQPDGAASLRELLRGPVPEPGRDAPVCDPLSPAKIRTLRLASDRLRAAEGQVRCALEHGSTAAQAAAIAACRQALHLLERP